MMLRFEDRLPGVLIVDSNPCSRDELARAMEHLGWHVCTAADGEEALEVYQQDGDRIDVALVALQLPGLLGVRVLSELAELNPELPTCAMSGNVSPYTASAFRRMSATPLFTKPMDIRALCFILHEMIAPRRQAVMGDGRWAMGDGRWAMVCKLGRASGRPPAPTPDRLDYTSASSRSLGFAAGLDFRVVRVPS